MGGVDQWRVYPEGSPGSASFSGQELKHNLSKVSALRGKAPLWGAEDQWCRFL